MTNDEILASASATSYAALYLNRTLRLGPGRQHWVDQLARLTPTQRQTLELRMLHWEELNLRSQSRDNVVDIASHQAAA